MSRSRRAAAPWGRLAIAAAVAGLAVVVSACEAGNNAPTLRYHPQSAGLDTTVHGIKVIDAFVLGAPVGSSLPAGQSAGVFLALYNYGSLDRLLSVSAPGTAKSALLPRGGLTVRDQQAVYLAGPKPSIVLTGLLHALPSGGSIRVVLDFMNAGSIALTLPVLPRDYDYATFSPAPAPTTKPAKRGATSPATGAPSSAPANSSPATAAP